MGAKAIKLGPCDKHPANCYDWNVDKWHIRNEINVVVNLKPGKKINFSFIYEA